MAGALDPNLPLPQMVPTRFIKPLPDLDAIEFASFDVNHPEPRPEHLQFIQGVYVRFIIKQIEALKDDRMNKVTFHIRGLASATGAKDHNTDLSNGRAASIGQAIKQQFDLQKRSSTFARGVTVEVDAKGLGDAAARKVLAVAQRVHPGVKFTNKAIDGVQGDFRGAILSLKVIEHLPDSDHPTYQCRQIFVFNLKKERVPVNQLVDEIAKLRKEHPGIALIGDLVLDELIEGLKEFFKAATSEFPIISESLEFIVPGDVAQCFDFTDPRGVRASYNFFGNENKKSLSLLGAVGKILKIAKFLPKIERALEKMKAEKILDKIQAVKKVLDGVLKDATDKDSVIRHILGDANTEFLVSMLRDEGDPGNFMAIPTSKFFPFQFKKPGFFAVQSFGSFAQTVGFDHALSSDLTLSFGAKDATGIGGFEAEVTISTDFSIRNAVASFGIAHGQMIMRPEVHP